MEVEFLGATQTVTGSMHVVHAPESKILLECGLFQGRRGESRERNERLPFRAREMDACVLSHAHIDHSGLMPMLYKSGFRGAVFCTPATKDLCTHMLADAARIQDYDARYVNRRIERGDIPGPPVEPLYDQDDVTGVLGLMETVPYRQRREIRPGVALTFHDAGHVLGSANVTLDVDDYGEERRIVFTGDLGRRHMPILKDPEIPGGANLLISESTYGGREHPDIETMDGALADVVNETYARGGKVVIPSFALERAQELIYALKRIRNAGRLPNVPVYVDSPLTVRLTDVFRRHPDCFDPQARALLAGGDSPFDFPGLTYIDAVEDSKAVSTSSDPAIVISASGMCESGRVLHHLKATIEDDKNTVLIVGWQAQHTLGRRLVEQRRRVPIFGVERDRNCRVVVLNGFSAHGDHSDLVEFAEAVRERGQLRRVALVHGELPGMTALKRALEERGFPEVVIPDKGDRIPV